MSMSFRCARPEALFQKVFGDLTVRDAAMPLLIPCYDMASAVPFVFSRADAVEADAFDFLLWGGASAAVANPTAVALTHVLHNKREFPFTTGMADLVVLSLGGSAPGAASSLGRPSSSSLLRIAGACQADMVDQAVSMAFEERRATNYVRI
ncbi:unnamed protein product [Miscanthus lutarioriparius]|uniref:PNPLA domain-containing protein n=1 Tax=Miscanthus lutarioriparius TaxID=422564 RepID=A0A811RK33_9POAL|nr:unnamed protein product [Miscanthus lutarioriparius]